jgi:hypothetical protein
MSRGRDPPADETADERPLRSPDARIRHPRPRRHLRHHAARRRAVARRHHDARGEAAGRRAPRRDGRRHHRGRLPDRLDGDFEAVSTRSPSASSAPCVCGLARAATATSTAAAEAVQAMPSAGASTPSSAPRRCICEFQLQLERGAGARARGRSVTRARNLVDDVEWSAMDATRTEHDFLCRCVEAAIKAGATTINIPDTVGYATPDEFRDVQDADRARAERRQGGLLDPLPRRPRPRGRQFAGRRRSAVPARSSAPSTASASAPAMPRWKSRDGDQDARRRHCRTRPASTRRC